MPARESCEYSFDNVLLRSLKSTLYVILLFFENLKSKHSLNIFRIKFRLSLGRSGIEDCYIHDDGIDVLFFKPRKFYPSCYLYKLHHELLCYEVGVYIARGHMVLVHGPIPCVRFSELSTYGLCLKKMLLLHKMDVPDSSHGEVTSICGPKGRLNQALYSKLRALHEILKALFKQFNVM